MPLDRCIAAMKQIGQAMSEKLKEASLGGLAVSVRVLLFRPRLAYDGAEVPPIEHGPCDTGGALNTRVGWLEIYVDDPTPTRGLN